MVDIIKELDKIWEVLSVVWDAIITFFIGFIEYPIKILEYFLMFVTWFMGFMEFLFFILVFLFNNLWFILVVFIGINCVKAYWEYKDNPHKRLIAFFSNCVYSGIYLSKLMFYIFQVLYDISAKILLKITELVIHAKKI